MTTRREATCCGVGLPSGYAEANREQGHRTAGMRPSVHVVRVRMLPGDMHSPGRSLLEVGHGH